MFWSKRAELWKSYLKIDDIFTYKTEADPLYVNKTLFPDLSPHLFIYTHTFLST